jgi:hypothetical protein
MAYFPKRSNMNAEKNQIRQTYQTPQLEQQTTYVLLTGISLPIGTSGTGNPLEMHDFLEEQQ